jgi:hypothetical protein
VRELLLNNFWSKSELFVQQRARHSPEPVPDDSMNAIDASRTPLLD